MSVWSKLRVFRDWLIAINVIALVVIIVFVILIAIAFTRENIQIYNGANISIYYQGVSLGYCGPNVAVGKNIQALVFKATSSPPVYNLSKWTFQSAYGFLSSDDNNNVVIKPQQDSTSEWYIYPVIITYGNNLYVIKNISSDMNMQLGVNCPGSNDDFRLVLGSNSTGFNIVVIQ